MRKYFNITVRFMQVLSLILNIFLTSFHRLWITRTSIPLSSALCMPPFNIYNPYKSVLFFISSWAWIRMQATQQGGIGEVSTNGNYHGFQDAILCLPSEIICILAIQWKLVAQGILCKSVLAKTSFCSQAFFKKCSDNILCSALDYSVSCQYKLESSLILLIFPDPF